jgi:hypothetical protein
VNANLAYFDKEMCSTSNNGCILLTFIRKWVINVILIRQCVVLLIVDAFLLTFIRKCVVFLIVDAFFLTFIRKYVVDACLAYFD